MKLINKKSVFEILIVYYSNIINEIIEIYKKKFFDNINNIYIYIINLFRNNEEENNVKNINIFYIDKYDFKNNKNKYLNNYDNKKNINNLIKRKYLVKLYKLL